MTVSDDALEKAEAFGLTPDRLAGMIMHSTRITHSRGNRRFQNYLFMVEGPWVLDLFRLDEKTLQVEGELDLAVNCNHCRDTKRVPVFDECQKCFGVGCDKCDEGLVMTSVPCPMCIITQKRTRGW